MGWADTPERVHSLAQVFSKLLTQEGLGQLWDLRGCGQSTPVFCSLSEPSRPLPPSLTESHELLPEEHHQATGTIFFMSPSHPSTKPSDRPPDSLQPPCQLAQADSERCAVSTVLLTAATPPYAQPAFPHPERSPPKPLDTKATHALTDGLYCRTLGRSKAC